MSALKILENCNTNGKSPRFSERRRALFPLNPNETCSETDSDLGHMSPLKSDSSDNEDGSCHSFDLKLSPSKNLSLPPKSSCIGDYDIIGIMDDNMSDTVFTPQNRMVEFTESMSPLYLSPFVNVLSHASKKTLLDTPLKGSPTNKLKTPHDSNSVSKVPKLIRKSLLDSGFEETSKRKILDESPPDNSKIAKLDPVGHSKVRTALFPDDQVTLPSKQFYSKTLDKLPILHTNYTMKPLIKSTSRRSYPTKRKNKGGINAGVRHKIRKPKQRKLSAKLVRKAITISNDPALQQYLKDMKEINNIHTHLIENKENINMIKPVTKKRACSPEPLEVKKFKPTVEENSTSELDDYDTKLQETRIEIEDAFNFSAEDDDISPNIDDIITSLNANQNSPEKNSIVLQAHDSITQSQNSIQLHNPSAETSSIANILLSPTSQMCDMASGLALNSPKKVKNLTNLLEEIPVENISSAPKRRFEKLFPMFTTYKTATAEKNKSVKKIKKTGHDQMLLDAGQKKFGTIQCKECDFVYLVGDSVDETIHNTYHTSTHLLKFHGWKNERVVTTTSNFKIVKIIPGDSKVWWKKVTEVMSIVDRELGCTFSTYDDTQVYLYIKNKVILGCISATPREDAYKMLSSIEDTVDMCSSESYPIKCCIMKLWVHANHRNNGIARDLMNSVKRNFMFGNILENNDIAMSSPTMAGKKFAAKYFKTSNFLVCVS